MASMNKNHNIVAQILAEGFILHRNVRLATQESPNFRFIMLKLSRR
jgi:hypothetical protein